MADKITPEKLSSLEALGYLGDDSLEFLMLRMNNIMIAEDSYMVTTKDGDLLPWWAEVKDEAKAKKFIDAVVDELEQKLKDKAKKT